MIGGIDLDDGDDTFVGLGGTVIGDITGELGNDTFDLIGANISGSVAGGADDDTYIVDDTAIDLVELADEGIDLVEAAVSYTLADNFENLTLIGSNDISGVGNGQNNKVTGNAGTTYCVAARDGTSSAAGMATTF